VGTHADSIYFRARYYSAGLGSLLSEDPVNPRELQAAPGSVGGWDEFNSPTLSVVHRNMFGSVNPANQRDPMGLQAGVGALGGGGAALLEECGSFGTTLEWYDLNGLPQGMT
jgi:hypothetical protein